MHLKGALHTHTTCSDGTLTPTEVVETYERLGFDFIALTDHDHLLRPECYDVLDLLESSVLVFRGMELTVFESGYCHVNRIEGDKEILYIFNHPAQLNLSLPKVIHRVKTIARRIPLDGIEITDKGFRTPEYDTPEIPLVKIASDDSHTKEACGRAWVELDSPRDKDSIIRAIRQGDFWNCYA
jgi:hypothetical protein